MYIIDKAPPYGVEKKSRKWGNRALFYKTKKRHLTLKKVEKRGAVEK